MKRFFTRNAKMVPESPVKAPSDEAEENSGFSSDGGGSSPPQVPEKNSPVKSPSPPTPRTTTPDLSQAVSTAAEEDARNVKPEQHEIKNASASIVSALDTTTTTTTAAAAAAHQPNEGTTAAAAAAQASKSAVACGWLLDAHVLSFMRWREIGSLHQLAAAAARLCEDPAVAPGLWMAACRSLGREASLYVPSNPPSLYTSAASPDAAAAAAADPAPAAAAPARVVGGSDGGGGGGGAGNGGMAWKRFFFDSLWPARGKWGGEAFSLAAASASADFKISVCVRFRPLAEEAQADSKLSLPLHQYIKLQRQQQAAKTKDEKANTKAKITVGSAPPPHFLDHVFGVLMRDPVTLPSSRVVVERRAAVEHIRRFKKDLLDGTPLAVGGLVEMPELKAEIGLWAAKAKSEDEDLDRVKRSVIVQELAERGGGSSLPPEVIEALLEAERLEAVNKQAEDAAFLDSKTKAHADKNGTGTAAGDAGDADEGGGDDDNGGLVDEVGAATLVGVAEVSEGLEGAEEQVKGLGGEEEDAASSSSSSSSLASTSRHHQRRRQRDGPRLLGLHPGRVVMFIPGQGVRPFPFTRVFGGSANQERVYEQSSVRPCVAALLNGFNTCLLHYGQTGSGKTHTAFGPPGALDGSTKVGEESGVVVRVLQEVVEGAKLLANPSFDPHHPKEWLRKNQQKTSRKEKKEKKENASAAGTEDACTGLTPEMSDEDQAEWILENELGMESEVGNSDDGATAVTTTLSAQYVEIYNDSVTDLFTGERCDVRRASSQSASTHGNSSSGLRGAVECPIQSVEEGLRLLRTGQVRKRFAATAMNERSSRAHTVFVLHVRQTLRKKKKKPPPSTSSSSSPIRKMTTTTSTMEGAAAAVAEGGEEEEEEEEEEESSKCVSATLHLVDLAGSERLKKSKAEGLRKAEAVGINESLLVLGKVINALVEGKSHVPYFECKLTTLLKSALGGASRTTAIVCCRGDDAQAEETLQALRFGERCALVSNSNQQVKASNSKEALQAIDATLRTCEDSAASLRLRGKDHLPAFRSLMDRVEQLRQRRRAIADVARG